MNLFEAVKQNVTTRQTVKLAKEIGTRAAAERHLLPEKTGRLY